MKRKLFDFKKQIFAQNGEDGMIEEIFNRIEPKSKFCIEFGASDGLHLSNTANLWKNGWKAFLIEGNPEKFIELQKNTNPHSCICLNKYVGIDEDDSLESILNHEGIHTQIDFLSIDIDGNDYYILQSLRNIRPTVILCEYNAMIPAWLDIFSDYPNTLGSSASALERIARSKGYELVGLTPTNAFFVTKEEFHKFSDLETDLKKICFDQLLCYVATSFEGDYILLGDYGFPYGFRNEYQGKIYSVNSGFDESSE